MLAGACNVKSGDLSGFSAWRTWSSAAIDEAPDLPGVYAFRLLGGVFGRFRGESDIVYVGSAGSINRRLRDHLPSRADELDVADRLRKACELGELEVAWKTLTGVEEAEEDEAELLRHYYWEHLELPPVNRGEPAIAVRKAIEHLSASGSPPREVAEKAIKHVIHEGHPEGCAKGPVAKED